MSLHLDENHNSGHSAGGVQPNHTPTPMNKPGGNNGSTLVKKKAAEKAPTTPYPTVP